MSLGWAYKLRSIKPALSMLREDPVRALMVGQGVELLPDVPIVDTGSLLEDNAISVIYGGNAGYSLGTDMLWSAPQMNPMVSLVW